MIGQTVRPEKASIRGTGASPMYARTAQQQPIQYERYNRQAPPQQQERRYQQPPPPQLQRREESLNQSGMVDRELKLNPSFIYFTERDFSISQESGGYVLKTNTPGNILVCIIKYGQPICTELLKSLNNIYKKIGNVRIGILALDYGNNLSIIKKSEGTRTPITKTPTVFFYTNGKPIVHYTGKVSDQDIYNFIFTIVRMIEDRKGKEATKPQQSAQATQSVQAEYPGGIPYNMVCNDNGKCYFTADTAYSGPSDSQLCLDGKCTYFKDEEAYNDNTKK